MFFAVYDGDKFLQKLLNEKTFAIIMYSMFFVIGEISIVKKIDNSIIESIGVEGVVCRQQL